MIQFILGLFVGAPIGAITMAVAASAKRDPVPPLGMDPASEPLGTVGPPLRSVLIEDPDSSARRPTARGRTTSP